MVEGVVAVSLKGGTLLYHKVRQHSSNWPFLHPHLLLGVLRLPLICQWRSSPTHTLPTHHHLFTYTRTHYV